MRSVFILGPVSSKLGYLEAGFTPIYNDELTLIGLAFFDELGKRAPEDQEVLCVQLAVGEARQMGKRQVLDFMLLVVDRGNDNYARIGIAHTNIRQTSRYDAGSIFDNCEPVRINLV